MIGAFNPDPREVRYGNGRSYRPGARTGREDDEARARARAGRQAVVEAARQIDVARRARAPRGASAGVDLGLVPSRLYRLQWRQPSGPGEVHAGDRRGPRREHEENKRDAPRAGRRRSDEEL